MLSRLLTAAVGIPLLVLAATVNSPVLSTLVFLLIGVLCIWEAHRADTGQTGRTTLSLANNAAILVVLVALTPALRESPVVFAVIACIGLALLVSGRLLGDRSTAVSLWVALPLMAAVSIRKLDIATGEPWFALHFGTPLLLVLLCIWAGDTAGFFVGKSVGTHKLAPLISPNKTWEGAIANFVISIAVGVALADWCRVSVPVGAAVGFFTGTIGQLGDLFQSGWKRSRGLKDSGGLLPGHGGFLDRFDSLLFSAPPAALLLLWGQAR
jgi:phosphatidate cytidylyltransferase